MKFKAFISYKHSENGRRHAISLETALKRYAKPTLARPMKIFRDEKHMKPDINLSKMVLSGLENSEYLIFLAERAAAESQWCQQELEYWCGHLKRTDKLIIALIEDDIMQEGTQRINFDGSTALPRLLQSYFISIPLYMDLRWAKTATDTDLQNPKYRYEINALTARLKGVNPEDLNDEDIRVFRRNIRLRNGTIGVLLAMLVVSGTSTFWALDAQKKAEKNLADRIEQETQKERLNFDKYVSEGDVFANSGDFSIALRYYQKADSILQKFPDDTQLLAEKPILVEKLTQSLAKSFSKK